MTMQEIVNQLNTWAHEYYVLDRPTVTDMEYDALYDRLLVLERQSGIILADSPTKRVGGQPLDSFVQHSHLGRLYSLDKVQSLDQLRLWVEKVYATVGVVDITVELKFDGLTISATYQDGQLIRVATRGNGTVGEDVTAQATTIRTLPLTIECNGTIEVQGESYMKLTALESFNQKYPNKALKNARNAAAGALRNLDPKQTALRNLDCVFYSITSGSDNAHINSQQELVSYLVRNNFTTDKYFLVAHNIEQIVERVQYIASIRDNLDYLIDGVVLKVDNFDAREQLGYTDKFPKWAVAYKFDSLEVVTTLTDIDWQVGRTGKLTPIAILEPIELCGATIKRATLNNYGDIQRKNLLLPCKVFVRRSNDVIPEVLRLAELLPNSRLIFPPQSCVACGSILQEDGAHLFCNNALHCIPQIVARITHYCSKNAMDIVGISDKTVSALVQQGLIASVADLYKLDYSQLISLEGFKDTKVNNVLNAIEDSKQCDLDKFIYALGIDNIGAVTARDLAVKYGSIRTLSEATVEDLMSIDQIGEVVAQAITHYFAVADNINILSQLFERGVKPISKQIPVQGKLFGKKIVLTGSLNTMTRSQATQLVFDNGGSVANSVGRSVNLVIAGTEPGSKLDKAVSMGIEIIDEQQFVQLLS